MSLAENLLNSLPNTYNANSRIAGDGEEEPHIVVDSSRKITVPDSLKTIAVTGDKDVETVTIDCINSWDGNNLYDFNIQIKCELPNGSEVTYPIDEKIIFPTHFSFDWVIGREFTIYPGKLKFWIVAKKLNQDGTLNKQWSSLQNEECSVARGSKTT